MGRTTKLNMIVTQFVASHINLCSTSSKNPNYIKSAHEYIRVEWAYVHSILSIEEL